jgi:hypothetical protein
MRTVVLAFVALASIVVGTGCKKPDCPGSFKEAGKAIECACAPNATGSVWGTGIYTSDSSICASAVHAGVITAAAGGTVSAAPAPGCESYEGTAGKGGAPSASYGKWDSSFFFPGHGDGKCPPVRTGADAWCPDKFNGAPNADALTSLACTCKPDAPVGSVWGSGIYTTDSSVCGAARHAGAIGKTGGVVTMKKAPGCASYVGSTANDVASAKWGAYQASFFFPGHGDGTCKLDTSCPASFAAIPEAEAAAGFPCDCPAGATGGVWGSGIYTSDSNVCAAAIHAGAVGPAGGKVTPKTTMGCPKYASSTANGITSTAYGPWQKSFFFPGHGEGTCSK